MSMTIRHRSVRGGEGPAHRAARRVLVDAFTSVGYGVGQEERHDGRRVDIAVTLPNGRRVAVEIQGSPISVKEMQARMAADRENGFAATLWIWVGARAAVLHAAGTTEARVAVEMRWLAQRYGVGLFALDDAGQPHRFHLAKVVRDPTEYSEWSPRTWYPRTPKTIKRASCEPCTFELAAAPGPGNRLGFPDWTAVLRPVPVSRSPRRRKPDQLREDDAA